MRPSLRYYYYHNSGEPDVFDPLDLDPQPVLWIDSINGTFVSTVDNNGTRARGNIIDSATAETGQALTNAGTLASKGVFNGEGWYMEAGAQFQTGSLGDYNFLHNGSDFEIWLAFWQTPAASGNIRALIQTNAFSTTALGILGYYDNTGNNNAFKPSVGNGPSAVVNRTINNAFTQNALNVLRWRKSGNTHTWWVNKVQKDTFTSVLSYSTSNHAQVLTTSGINAASATHYFKDLVIFDRVLTDDEVTQMWDRTFTTITPTDLNVYIMKGDSMAAGRATNSAIAADLTGVIPGAYAARFNSNTPDASTWVGKLELGVNQTLIAENITTQHGSEMRFGKTMGALKDTFILKYGVGSTPLVQNGSVDWNIASSNESYIRFRDQALPQALRDIVHVYRRNPVFRGYIWLHGPNDAVIGGSGVSWSRSGTTVTVTDTAHGMASNQTIPITVSSDTDAIPLGIYTITVTNANTYTFTGVNTGGTSGTLSYSAGSTYKTNFTALFNAIVDYINDTIRNEVTGATGYSTDKLRLLINRTYGTSTSFDATSYADVRAAQVDIGDNYLTDNPGKVGRVLGSSWFDVDGTPLQDTIHYTTAGYDTVGGLIAAHYDNFINE